MLLADRNSVRCVDPASGEILIQAPLELLRQVRGLTASTLRLHLCTGLSPLKFLGCDSRPENLKTIALQHIEVVVVLSAKTFGGDSPQPLMSGLRCPLRFLANRGEGPLAYRLEAWRSQSYLCSFSVSSGRLATASCWG